MEGRSGNRLREAGLGQIRVPIPENYLRGLDVQRRDFEDYSHPSYLRGVFSRNGWWYYYLYGLVVKVPLGTWGLFLVALLGRSVFCMRHHAMGQSISSSSSRLCGELTLACSAIAIVCVVSSQSGFSHHFRYVLPFFPFGFVWISRVAESSLVHLRHLAWAAVVCTVCASLWSFPHSLSYFNLIAGGSRNGHAHLIHSSIDWGQDLKFLKRWLDGRPDAKPLYLLLYGDVDPALMGLMSEVPEFTTVEGKEPILLLKPGWYAVSVNFLRGYSWRALLGNGRFINVPEGACTQLLEREPVATAGYSIYIYKIHQSELGPQD